MPRHDYQLNTPSLIISLKLYILRVCQFHTKCPQRQLPLNCKFYTSILMGLVCLILRIIKCQIKPFSYLPNSNNHLQNFIIIKPISSSKLFNAWKHFPTNKSEALIMINKNWHKKFPTYKKNHSSNNTQVNKCTKKLAIKLDIIKL